MKEVVKPERTYTFYTDEEKRQIIAASEASNTTLRKFCETHGISRFSLAKWRHQLASREMVAEKEPAFIEITRKSIAEPKKSYSSRYRGIPLQMGPYQILVPDHFEEKTLEHILTILERRHVHRF